jgi:hypothetical protein
MEFHRKLSSGQPTGMTLHSPAMPTLFLLVMVGSSCRSWETEKNPLQTPHSLLQWLPCSTLDFVLYDLNSTIIWQCFDYPTDTLLPNQLLQVRSQLVSNSSETNHSTGIFQIKMQSDGNIVLYQYAVGIPDTPDYAHWSAVTNFVRNNATLMLDKNGRLYMLNSMGVIVKNITNEVIPS